MAKTHLKLVGGRTNVCGEDGPFAYQRKFVFCPNCLASDEKGHTEEELRKLGIIK